jgi:hypothetical protein
MIDANGTAFHGSTFFATVKQLFEALGAPDYSNNTGEDKENYEWVRLTDATGDAFTVYDWKQDRPLGWDERVEWHIGARSLEISEAARSQIKKLLAAR